MEEDTEIDCADVHNLHNSSAVCLFVQTTNACQIDVGFVNYNEFLYCDFPRSLIPLAIFLELVFLLIYFIALGITADNFFCPSLVVLAKTLRMSDNIAGVTLLAFGNGAPDVFSAIAAIGNMNNGDAGMAVGALLGACMFVTTMVAGTIAVVRPFQAMQRPILRDIIFLSFGVFYVFYILYTGRITLILSVGFIIMYIAYVVVVLVGRYIYQKQKAARLKAAGDATSASAAAGKKEDEDISFIIFDPEVTDYNVLHAEHLRRPRALHVMPPPEPSENGIIPVPYDSESDTEHTPLLSKSSEDGQSNAWDDFIVAIRPIELATWPEKMWYTKLYLIIRAPAYLFLIFNIPVVDQTEKKDLWNRHLRCINTVLGLTLATVIADYNSATYVINGVCPVWVIVLVGSFTLAVIIYCLTTNEEPPWWHSAFAFVGFAIAVIWIQTIASEIVNLLTSFGVVFNISTTILGLTLLAWGNSIGDFIADITVARQGMPRIGISACYGGPFFNIMIGVGIPFLIKTSADGPVKIDFTSVQVCLVAFLLLVLMTTLIVMLVQKFHFTRKYGFFLYFVYVVFLALAILSELDIINILAFE